MTQPTSAYWISLANTYVIAYARLFGVPPSKHAVLFTMTVAEHETRNGRAWPGCNNFGGVQLRRLTDVERAAFNVGVLKQGSRLPGNPGGELHVDTTPTAAHGNVPYPVWFAAFPTVLDGVSYFLKVLLKNRPQCRAACDHENGTLADLATCQFLTGYYEGFRAGSRPLGKRSLPLTPPEQANIDDYTAALKRNFLAISMLIGEWDPGGTLPGRVSESVPVPPFNLDTIKGYQAALTFLAIRMGHTTFDPKGIDGIHGPGTDAAVKAFQVYAAIEVDGDVGPQTIGKLREVLTMAGANV